MIFSGHLFWLSECQLNDIWLFLRSLSLIFHKQGSFLLYIICINLFYVFFITWTEHFIYNRAPVVLCIVWSMVLSQYISRECLHKRFFQMGILFLKDINLKSDWKIG